MTMFGWVGEKALGSLRSPLGNAGILRCAQNDDVKRTTARTTATARAKTKYRDLSTAAAKCAAFGRDDVCWGGGKRTSNCKNKSWLGDGIHSHLRRIKPRRRWGTQAYFGW